jgi:hypothetical protein
MPVLPVPEVPVPEVPLEPVVVPPLVPDAVPEGMEAARAAAFVDFCQALLNSNEFIYMN